jgi:hypothetical protein
MELPADQFWFTKASTAIVDPFRAIRFPKRSDALDYEAESVFVIGKKCPHVSLDKAAQVIFGYCAGKMSVCATGSWRVLISHSANPFTRTRRSDLANIRDQSRRTILL